VAVEKIGDVSVEAGDPVGEVGRVEVDHGGAFEVTGRELVGRSHVEYHQALRWILLDRSAVGRRHNANTAGMRGGGRGFGCDRGGCHRGGRGICGFRVGGP